MSQNTVELLLKARDEMSAAVNKASNAVNNFSKIAENLRISDNFSNKLKLGFDSLSQSILTAGKSVGIFALDLGKQTIAFATAQIGISGFAAAIDMAKSVVIDFNDSMANFEVSYETMFSGSKEAANEFINMLDKFNEKTPWEFPAIAQLSNQLLNAGWAAKNVIPDMKALGDAVAASGRGAYALDHIVIALSQIKMAGKLRYQDLMQLNNFIPASQIIAKELGLKGNQITNIGDQQINSDKAIDALISGIEKKYGGLMERMNKTFSAQFATMKDNLRMIFSDMTKPVYDYLTERMKSFNDWTSKIKSAIKENGVKKAFEDLIPKETQEKIHITFNKFASYANSVSGLATALGKATTALGLFGMASSAINFMIAISTKALNAMAAAVNAVSAATNSYYTKITNKFSEMKDGVLNVAKEVGRWGSFVKDMVNFKGVSQATYNYNKSTNAKPTSYFEDPNEGSPDYKPKTKLELGIEDYKSDFFQNFKKVSDSAQKVWDKTKLNFKFPTGDYFNDFMNSFSVPDSKSQKQAQETINNQPGTSIPLGDEVSEKFRNETNKIKDAFDKLNQAIISETGTSYELGMTRINDEIDKMNREIMVKASENGVDASQLKTKMDEYARIMKEPIIRAQKEAMAELKNNTALTLAQMTGDKKAQAEAEYQIAKAGIEKELREKYKAVAKSQNDAEAQKAINNMRAAEEAKIGQELKQKQNDAEYEIYDRKVEFNKLSIDLYGKSKDSISILNNQILQDKLATLKKELQSIGDNEQRKIEIMREAAETQKQIDNTPKSSNDALLAGIKTQSQSWNSYFEDVKNIGVSAAQSLNDSFQSFFFDALTGQMKSFGDYLKSFWQGIAKAISQTLANAFANKIISSLLGNVLGSSSMPAGLSLGVSSGLKYRAAGGSINPHDAYIVGEKGPELFVSQYAGNIIPNQALRSASAAVNTSPTIVTQPAISINIQNNTGTPVEAKTDVKFDGQRQIVTIMLDALHRDIMGIKTMIKGMAKV